MKLQERLEEVMRAKGWEHADLYRVVKPLGVTSSAVSQWLGKGSKEIKSIGDIRVAQALEEESGYAAAWIAKGTGPKFAPRANREVDSASAGERSAVYMVLLAMITTHHNPDALLSALDAISSTTGELPEDALAAVQRFRALIARQAAAGRGSTHR